jgi:uracil-DNA glycosylase family 4
VQSNDEAIPLIHETDGNRVVACERCPALCASRAGIINGRGDENADILFLAEKPGQYDDQRMRAFSGDDGKVLAALMLEAGIAPSEVYTTYAVRCWPKGNRPSTAAEIRACNEHLMADITTVQPKVIVTLGAKAYNSLMKGVWSTAIGTSQLLDYEGGTATVIPTFAPGFLLRGNWGLVPLIVTHLEKARATAAGRLDVQPVDTLERVSATTLTEVAVIKEFLLTLDAITVDSETTGLDWREGAGADPHGLRRASDAPRRRGGRRPSGAVLLRERTARRGAAHRGATGERDRQGHRELAVRHPLLRAGRGRRVR